MAKPLYEDKPFDSSKTDSLGLWGIGGGGSRPPLDDDFLPEEYRRPVEVHTQTKPLADKALSTEILPPQSEADHNALDA